ncbi:MAG: haloalkane dehalogenase [Candidatus Thorarchaeota archaeon SMTZ-45]|nr:MAG: haloalkane dehalogenase [Candidatus Thorarchaeota archaeon SMTZ1-45]KXH75910.1 MAG: haloalkane dehalogenase [Candidatus Thorarchaeota archaeon SMTZ-45]
MPREDTLRTPDYRFDDLPDYNFQANYVDIKGLRIHYVDEGPKEAPPILLMHGEPSWSYLYRKMIPPLVKEGFRSIAPDLMGFGKSDKLPRIKDYSHTKHVSVILEFVRKMNLRDITLFCQDWGGLIGLRVVGEEPNRFSRIIAANTGLPSAKGIRAKIGYPLFKLQIKRMGRVTQSQLQEHTDFMRWVAFSKTVPELPIGDIIQMATLSKLSADVIRAYEAPFPDESYKAGARIFPYLVPSELSKNRKVWDKVLTKWKKPFLTAFSDRDPITRGGEKYFQKMIPGAQDREHVIVKDAGHFLQEDKGQELAQIILNFIQQG